MKIERKDIVYVGEDNHISYYEKEKKDRINSIFDEKQLIFYLEKGYSGYYIELDIIPEMEYTNNDILFEKAKVNKFEFQYKILGYSMYRGGFPYCKTAEDALKLLNEIIRLLLK